MKHTDNRRYRRLREQATRWNIPIRTLRSWCAKGLVPAIRMGRSLWIADDELVAAFESRRIKGDEK